MKRISELQQMYAEHCGYRNFEELREKNEEAARIWYMQMLKPKPKEDKNDPN